MIKLLSISLLFLFAVNISNLTAQFRVAGNLQHDMGIGFNPPHELLLTRTWLHTSATYQSSDFRLTWSNRLVYPFHTRTDSISFSTNELYAEIYFNNFDLSVGRQNLSFGLSEFSPFNSYLNPLDVRDFLTAPLPDLRRGNDAIYTHYYLSNSDFQLALSWFPRAWKLPEENSIWFPVNVFPSELDLEFVEEKRVQRLSDISFAMQYNFSPVRNVNTGIYLSRWVNALPYYFKSADLTDFDNLPETITMQERYRNNWMAGLGLEYMFQNGFTLRTEHVYRNGEKLDVFPDEISILQESEIELNRLLAAVDTLIKYSEFGFLDESPVLQSHISLDYQRSSMFLSLQFDVNLILNHTEQMAQEEYFMNLGLVYRNSFFRDLLSTDFLAFYQIQGQDFYLSPSISYDVADNFSIQAGAHLFGGKKPTDLYGHLSYHSFQRNSHGFFRVSFFW